MCRFIAYLGKDLVLEKLLKNPDNSLINQSKSSKEGHTRLNADGVGIGWYNFSIDDLPAIYSSTQPAWSNQNLLDIISKISSSCFIGHVRASTIGTISTSNCHPFKYNNYLFSHNGTIGDFNEIKQDVISILNSDVFINIKGQTDSEYFFSLMLNYIIDKKKEVNSNNITNAFKYAINKIHKLKVKHKISSNSRLNTVFTDGKQLVATRYSSDNNGKALSLYYAIGSGVKASGEELMIPVRSNWSQSIVISSEPLNCVADEWQEIPQNHFLIIDKRYNISLKKII